MNIKCKLLVYSSFILVLIMVSGFGPALNQSGEPDQSAARVDVTDSYPEPGQGCLASGCHKGIEPIRQHDSKMAGEIYKKGLQKGDPNGCVVCHFGNAKTSDQDRAHEGMTRFPASMWVLDKTCGQCHEEHSYTMHRNLMQTEAGKIQGAIWGWGAQTGYKSVYGNYDLDDPDGKVPMIGSDTYKAYMKDLMEAHPYAFPDELAEVPEVDLATLEEHPEQAIFTYIRSDCQRCHVGVRGKQRRGDYRGMGCAACHIPYSDAGFYEGNDPSTPKDKPGKMLVHSIQSSRKAKVTANGITYSGIPSEQCTSCHNRGKRIGVSFLGLMESPYDTPWDEIGNGQSKLHGKKYNFINDDTHHSLKSREGNPEGRILCQDCHHTTDLHGNGNIGGTTFAEVEIECADCHGTPQKYPWELPLGFGDEFGMILADDPRGTTSKLLGIQERFSTVYPVEDGYLLTARGNPFGNIVRRGREVIMHSATGLDFHVPVLKNLAIDDAWQEPVKAETAMMGVRGHLENMECYACHATWAAQCYGCHVKVDYSKRATSMDWVKSGNAHFANGETAETMPGGHPRMQPGKIKEGRTYLRWEDPILGINGEGRVGPLIPGCQQITTVIGEDGEPLVTNKIWRTPPYMENGGKEGQRGIDMSPAQPHTMSRHARECTACHTNPKVLGYGMNNGAFMLGYDKDHYSDIQNEKGELLSQNATPQLYKIEGLDMDLSQIVTRDGKQLQTVGHHWELSGPLTQEQRERMERVGVCIACHQDIPEGDLAVAAMVKTGEILKLTPHSDYEHSKLLNSDIRWAALTRLLAPVIIILLILSFFIFIKYRKLKRQIHG